MVQNEHFNKMETKCFSISFVLKELYPKSFEKFVCHAYELDEVKSR